MFCPVCRSLMMPKEGRRFCVKCGEFRDVSQQSVMVGSSKASEKEMVILEGEDLDILPRTQDVECPQCGHRDAWWFLRQTRKADEAETMFLECTKCRNRWRRY